MAPYAGGERTGDRSGRNAALNCRADPNQILDGVRTRKPCICTAEVGHRSVSVCHMGVISQRLGGKRLTWDPTKEEFGEKEANAMMSRPMHNGWKLEA